VTLAVGRAPGGLLRRLLPPHQPAVAALGTDRAAHLKADMVKVAMSFDVSDDDTLVLRLDYLEVVIHKPPVA
jgi:hypothetical protein